MINTPTASFSIFSLAREDVCSNARTFSFSFCLFCLYLFIFFLYFTPIVILLLCDYRVRVFQQFVVDADRYKRTLDFCCPFLLTLKWPPPTSPRSLPRLFGALVCYAPPDYQSYVMTRTLCVRRVVVRYVLLILFVKNAKTGQLIFANFICGIRIPC